MKKEWMPISEQEYMQLKSHPISIDDFALNQAEHSKYPPAGYGFFNPCVEEKDGKQYLTWFHYESCD